MSLFWLFILVAAIFLFLAVGFLVCTTFMFGDVVTMLSSRLSESKDDD